MWKVENLFARKKFFGVCGLDVVFLVVFDPDYAFFMYMYIV